MDYPIGGSGAVVDALVRGLTKHGGELRLNSPVAKLLVDDAGRCNGVELRNGETVRARTAVVTNAPVWATWSLLPESARSATRESLARAGPADGRPLDPDTPPTPSFVHLHLGIRAEGLSEQARSPPRAPLRAHAFNDWSTRQALESIHHISIPDREQLTAPGSAVFVSVPSILDPSLAPPGRCNFHHNKSGVACLQRYAQTRDVAGTRFTRTRLQPSRTSCGRACAAALTSAYVTESRVAGSSGYI